MELHFEAVKNVKLFLRRPLVGQGNGKGLRIAKSLGVPKAVSRYRGVLFAFGSAAMGRGLDLSGLWKWNIVVSGQEAPL